MSRFYLQDMKSSKPFTKSVEDLMVYFTSHIKSKFTSQAPWNQFHIYLTTQTAAHERLWWKDVAADWEFEVRLPLDVIMVIRWYSTAMTTKEIQLRECDVLHTSLMSPSWLHQQKSHRMMRIDSSTAKSPLIPNDFLSWSQILFTLFFSLRFKVLNFSFSVAEISTSQNDLRGDLLSVENRVSRFNYSTQKSLSDTDINKSSTVSQLQHFILPVR